MCKGGGEWSGGGRALSCGDGCVCVQVESQVEESGLVVAGLYHAHDNLRDTHIDVFSQRIADKVLYWRLLISGACARDIKRTVRRIFGILRGDVQMNLFYPFCFHSSFQTHIVLGSFWLRDSNINTVVGVLFLEIKFIFLV